VLVLLNKHLELRVLDHFGKLVEASGTRFDLVGGESSIQVELADAGGLVVWARALVVL
jgi:hypothetical protein